MRWTRTMKTPPKIFRKMNYRSNFCMCIVDNTTSLRLVGCFAKCVAHAARQTFFVFWLRNLSTIKNGFDTFSTQFLAGGSSTEKN